MSSLTKVDLWNRALHRIGETTIIESEEEESNPAEVCRLHYSDCLGKALENFPWPFATKQAALSQPEGVTRTGWEYVYALPDDCVRPIALLAEDERLGLKAVGGRYPFAVMLNDTADGKLLCTDLDSTDFECLEYTALVEDVRMWPRQFCDALVWLLASEAAFAIKKDPTLAGHMLEAYAASIMQARADVLNGQQADPEPTTPSIAIRG